MTILGDRRFDDNGVARLGEDPGDPADQVIELQRRVVRNLDGTPKLALFDLTVFVGDDDCTFNGMTREDLRRLGTELGRLSSAE